MVRLYDELAPDGNLAFSPYSVSRAFATLFVGARGQTRAELARAFDFDDGVHEQMRATDRELADRAPVRLDSANAAWAQAGWPMEQAFLAAVDDDLRTADFEAEPDTARRAIDAWVKERTRGKIEELFPPDVITADTRLVLANALYLMARWETPFHESWTEERPFHRIDGTRVAVPFMYGRRDVGYAEGDGWEAVELPYEGERLALLAVGPRAAAFSDVVEALALPDVLAALGQTTVLLRLPRFEIRQEHPLVEPLLRLGVRDAFDGRRADLSGISPERIFVGDARQKVFIRTDEAGTEGAAATGVAMQRLSRPREVTFDRPFVFFVRDRPTGAVLFMGRVVDPSAA